jgi:hypothetical protein
MESANRREVISQRFTVAPFESCGSGFWGRPASESGTLRHGDGAHGPTDRCRRSFVLPTL